MDDNQIKIDDLINEEIKDNNYSGYFKCDLHIHTDYSNKTKTNDYKGVFELKKLIEKISEPQYDIKLLSFTDHNIINVPVYEEYYNDNSLNIKDRCLLVGIELDIIVEDFLLEKLKANIEHTECDKKKYHSLIIFKSNNAKKLNDYLNQMYKKISDEYNEKNNTNIDLNDENKDLKSRITSFDRFAEYFIDEDYIVISHGKKEANIVDAYKSYNNGLTEAQVMVLIGIINAVEMSPGNNAKVINHFNSGFQSLLSDDFSAKKEVPYVVFSDNHQISCYPKHDSAQNLEKEVFTWIKGDLSFETLRMAFVDPTSRILVSSDIPNLPEKYIEEIKFNTIKDGFEKVQNVKLSPGINTIIGGRSSGKSLLFNSILYSLSSGKDKSKIGDYVKESNKVLKLETIQSKLNCEEEFKNNNICEINAFTQEEIIELFENNGEGLKEHLDFYKLDAIEINEKISTYNLAIDRFTSAYSDLLNKKNNYNSSLPITTFKEASKILNEKYEYKSALETIKNNIDLSSIEIDNVIKKVNAEIQNAIIIKELKLKDKLVFDLAELEVIDNYINLLNNKCEKLKKLFNKTYVKEKYLINLESSLNEISNKYLTSETEKISYAKENVKNELTKMYDYFKTKLFFKKYATDLENLNIKIDEKNNQISDSYTLNTKVDCEINKEFLYNIISEKIRDLDKEKSIENNFIDLMNDNIKIFRKDNSYENVVGLFSLVKNSINESLTPKYTIIESDNDISLNSDNMSQGKKASIYLEIILEKCKSNNSIIMIDQPEDNIDNEFITDVMIDKIRDLRMKNQVILVTHNAAIAINSDSENIIISENKDGIFEYNIGGLELEKHRKKICKLLDGGNYIFDNRYHKYNIINTKVSEPIRKGEINE